MGIMSKIKGILFDEDEIEVPIDSDQLPEREPKEVKRVEKKASSGFIEHHHDDEEEKDTIKEIIIPKEEKEDIKPINKYMVDNETMDRDFPTRVEKKNPYSDTNHDFNYSRESRKYTNDNIDSKSVDDVRKEYNIAPPVKKHTEEVKDYRKMVSTKKEDTKKPFKVTPVISPVYGILDKNYTADDVLEKRELINKTNSGVKPRMFGPVSYNDQPLPTLKKSNTTLKEDLVELNETVNELITEPVVSESIENVEEDIVIQTENYDDYETSSIENEYIGNNNIEDAFDTTDEYKAINEHDNEESIQDDNLDDTVPSIDVEALIDKNDDDDDDDENLDNTIETDLFNLIDSMYKSDDKESDGE